MLEVGAVHFTRTVLKLTIQFTNEVDHNPAVLQRDSRHRNHFAVEVFAPGLSLPLQARYSSGLCGRVIVWTLRAPWLASTIAPAP
jgi:hypothetical protein